MISVQKAIFPGLAIGCIFLVMITNLIANPKFVLASSPPKPAATAIPATPQPVVKEAPSAVEKQEQVSKASSSVGSGECPINPRFPESIQQWCGLIEQYAVEKGVDPNLVASVMLQESGGNSQAYSKSGAVGLMQVMPRDGLAANFMCKAGPCFAARPSMKELFDPEYNVAYGVGMLADLILKSGGDIREALRRYGPYDMGYGYADIVLGIWQRFQ